MIERRRLWWAALIPLSCLPLGCTRNTCDLQSTPFAASPSYVAERPPQPEPVADGHNAARLETCHAPTASADHRALLPATLHAGTQSASDTTAVRADPDPPSARHWLDAAAQPAPPDTRPEAPDEPAAPDASPPDAPPLDVQLSLTGIYQLALRDAGRHLGRPTADYDLLLARRLWGGAKAAARVQGACGRGLDAALNTINGVNDEAEAARPVAVTELWIEQEFDDGQILLTFGKLDLAHYFDGGVPAAEENRRFLASAFRNDPTIPFPENGLAARVELARWGWPYYAIGAANALAHRDTLGTDDLDRDRVLWIHELGLRTKVGRLHGEYHAIFWQRTDEGVELATGRPAGGRRGTSFGFQQDLPAGLTAFGRLGRTSGRTEPIRSHGSLGILRREPLPGRPDDAAGIAVARSEMSHDLHAPGLGTETTFEAFYRLAVTRWFELTFDLQLIDNPAAVGAADPVVVLALRGRVHF